MYANLIVTNVLIYLKILKLLARFQTIGLLIILSFTETEYIFTI